MEYILTEWGNELQRILANHHNVDMNVSLSDRFMMCWGGFYSWTYRTCLLGS